MNHIKYIYVKNYLTNDSFESKGRVILDSDYLDEQIEELLSEKALSSNYNMNFTFDGVIFNISQIVNKNLTKIEVEAKCSISEKTLNSGFEYCCENHEVGLLVQEFYHELIA